MGTRHEGKIKQTAYQRSVLRRRTNVSVYGSAWFATVWIWPRSRPESPSTPAGVPAQGVEGDVVMEAEAGRGGVTQRQFYLHKMHHALLKAGTWSFFLDFDMHKQRLRDKGGKGGKERKRKGKKQ